MACWEELSRVQLEKEMSPSRWNPTKSSNEVIQEYLSISQDATSSARAVIPHELNIPYGTEPAQVYDLYGSNLPTETPIFIYIHGGYWQEGSKDIAGGIALLTYKMQIRTIVFGYTLAPHAKLSAIETELRQLLKLLCQSSSGVIPKFIIGGHSAGGQLTASLLHSPALTSDIAKAIVGIVLISGVFDLRPLLPTSINSVLDLSQNEAQASSPLLLPFNNNIDFSSLRTLVLVGEFDSPKFRRQSFAYFQKLTSLPEGQPSRTTFHTTLGDDHFTIVQNLANETSAVYHILKEFLKNV